MAADTRKVLVFFTLVVLPLLSELHAANSLKVCQPCPSLCDCFLSTEHERCTVNCSNRQLQSIPELDELPSAMTVDEL